MITYAVDQRNILRRHGLGSLLLGRSTGNLAKIGISETQYQKSATVSSSLVCLISNAVPAAKTFSDEYRVDTSPYLLQACKWRCGTRVEAANWTWTWITR